MLALLAGPGPGAYCVFTQRLRLDCVSGTHQYKYMGNPYRGHLTVNQRVYITHIEPVSTLTHTLFYESHVSAK